MNDEKRQNFDEFKDKVYGDIRLLEALEIDIVDELEANSIGEGCFKILMMGVSKSFLPYLNRKMREAKKINELSNQAYELIARSDIKEKLCEHLDESIKLPIDVANIISPVLYEIAEEGDLPFDTMLWALISKKIADRGVKEYCN